MKLITLPRDQFQYDCQSWPEKAMAPHSSTLAWKIPWTEEPGRLQSMGSLRVRQDFTFTLHFHALEKEMATHSSVLAWRILGTGAWWPAVYGVAQNRTRLKWLSSSQSWLYCFCMLPLPFIYKSYSPWVVSRAEGSAFSQESALPSGCWGLK